MSSFTISLDKIYSRKLAQLREQEYPQLTEEEAGKKAFRAMLDAKVQSSGLIVR
jgi:hypothetical protein